MPLAAFNGALLDPAQAQTDLLMLFIRANESCEFGRTHGFVNIRSVEQYRFQVPIRSYADFKRPIDRMAAGEPGVLICDPVVAFEETGGTSAGAKLIPYTRGSLDAFRAAVLPWLAELAGRRPGVCSGKTYVSISPATRRQMFSPAGIPIGLASEAAYLGEDLVGPFLSILVVAPEIATISDVHSWRIATLSGLISCADLSFVSVWSPTFFLGLIEAIADNVREIEPQLDRAAKARLGAFKQSGGTDTSILWPRLDTISCWNDASSAIFAARLATLCPQATIEPKGLLATEAAITIPFAGKSCDGTLGCLPALTSTFLEFIDDNGVSHLADELTVGAGYRVVVTTPGGLYRYDMGDRVLCVGHHGLVARLVFQGRAGLVSDMVGEKLDEAFVTQVLAMLPCAAALLPRAVPKACYELWLDTDVDLHPLSALVETRLCQNPQYAYARKIGQLGPLIALSKPDFVAARQEARLKTGARLGDMKHASLILD